MAILELMLRCKVGAPVESMIEHIRTRVDWNSRYIRLGNPVLPWLLGLSAGAVHSRFAPDAPLVTSGLVSDDDDGALTLVDRLTRLHWLRCEPGRGRRGHCGRPARWRYHRGRALWSAGTRAGSVGRHAAAQRTPEKYDPTLIRADVHPVQLADRLVEGGARHFSLCLQGPPGSGKSAFVRYVADRLDLEVIQKRASDLMSMCVGGTEKAIAAAFTEARDAEAFLVFDEADSLLADRRLAQRSWEVSQDPVASGSFVSPRVSSASRASPTVWRGWRREMV